MAGRENNRVVDTIQSPDLDLIKTLLKSCAETNVSANLDEVKQHFKEINQNSSPEIWGTDDIQVVLQ